MWTCSICQLPNADRHARFVAIDPESVIGDVNADGEFNISDIVIVQKWQLGVPDTELKDLRASDLCQDNRLDEFDLCLMIRELVEKNAESLKTEIIIKI